jgi:hypothetical protein
MDICPQTLKPLVEILCYIKVRRAPGQPTTGRCKCELDEPWPVDKAGEKQPTDAQLSDRFPGSVAVCRRSTFKYAGGPVTRCNGALRYDVCKYKRHIEILFNSPTPLDSYDSPDIFEVEDLVGLCPIEAVKDLFGIGGAVKSLISMAPAAQPGLDQMLATLLTSAKPAPEYYTPPAILSQYALNELSHWLSEPTPAKQKPLALTCMESGRAEIADIIAELGTLKSPLSRTMQNVLQRVFSSGLNTIANGAPDDLWLAEMAATIPQHQ